MRSYRRASIGRFVHEPDHLEWMQPIREHVPVYAASETAAADDQRAPRVRMARTVRGPPRGPDNQAENESRLARNGGGP